MSTRILPLAAFALGLTAPARAQFVDSPGSLPSGAFNNRSTENVDMGDVDLDGDLDLLFADGGEDHLQRNRLWINQGGLQGGITGEFVDESNSRLPLVFDSSHDVEFADFDGDGDLDVHVSNTSIISNQGNRFWINQGGLQGGQIGFFVDETQQRWVGLGGAGSSIWPGQVLGAGGFIDWSGDSDFADLDNDGDLDLVHTSYGPSFVGNVPTRLFFNDGLGFFTEFNPSGFSLPGTQHLDGFPGLWCEGLQAANTTNTDGSFCDIASTVIDVELVDIDQDFDIDLSVCGRDQAPRLFANRLDPSTLAPAGLGFRDVSALVYPAGVTTGFGHYEHELGDLDRDGDLDVFGVNWLIGTGFLDVTLQNQGDGTMAGLTTVVDSLSDDNEADFIDFDGDGDLDVFIANFSGNERLYANEPAPGGWTLQNVTASQLPGVGLISYDADVGDLDGDGDYDVLVANNFFQRDFLLDNQGDVPDTTPPYLPRIEALPDRLCSAEPSVVRAHVYDNAPLYQTAFQATWVQVRLEGGQEISYPALHSGGQVFRAELPGQLAGTIEYWFVSEDAYGNRGESAVQSFEAGCPSPTSYCQPPGPNSVRPEGAALTFLAGAPGALLQFLIEGAPQGQFGLLFFGSQSTDAPFGCGRRCVGGSVQRSSPYALGAQPQVLAWDTSAMQVPSPFFIQFWYRDPTHLPVCGATFNLSDALELP